MYIMLSGTIPFNGRDQREVLISVLNGYVDLNAPNIRHISDGAKDLLSRLLTKDPDIRITANNACNHPWVTGNLPSPSSVMDVNIFNNIEQFSNF